ncbi:MAG: hypothetical protein ACE5F1_02140 [Planctomycetota bacterium]
MTKATGIDVSSGYIHLVELDGSARRYQVTKSHVSERGGSEEGADDPGDASLDIALAFQASGISRERCTYAVPGSRCVLRNMVLPFRGRDEIRKVLKFEAESCIHSHSIDEVIVDGYLVEEREGNTELFMAACPKAFLGSEFKMLEKQNVETEWADLDATLLVEAARSLSVFDQDPDEDDDPGEGRSENGEADASRRVGHDLVLRIGSDAILMILVAGGRLKTARVLRWGYDRIGRSLAEDLGSQGEAVLPAVRTWLYGKGRGLSEQDPEPAEIQSDEGFVLEHEESEEGGEDAPGQRPEPGPRVAMELREHDLRPAGRCLAEMVMREVVRFLSGLDPDLYPGRILISGSGALLPGFGEELEEISAMRVELLDLLGRAGEGNGPEPGLDLAFAAALSGLGAVPGSLNFRQEELVFKHKFDRLKFPLALCALLLASFLLMSDLLLMRGTRYVEGLIGLAKPQQGSSKMRNRLPEYKGFLSALARPTRNGPLRRHMSNDAAVKLMRELKQKGVKERIPHIRRYLKKHKKELQRQTGYFPELELESGLSVLVAFSELIDKADESPAVDRCVIPSIHLQVGSRENDRFLKFEVAFFGNARIEKQAFERIIQDSLGPKSPFASVESGGEQIWPGGGDYNYTLKLKPSFENFQPEAVR